MAEDPVCWAGRWAFNSDNSDWAEPCTRDMKPTHIITDPDTPGAVIIELCDHHYQDVLAQGLIETPTPSTEEQAWGRTIRPDLDAKMRGA